MIAYKEMNRCFVVCLWYKSFLYILKKRKYKETEEYGTDTKRKEPAFQRKR